MNIPMPNEVQPVSFLDYAAQFAQLDGMKQRQRLIDMQMQQMPQEQARRDRLEDAQIDREETNSLSDRHKVASQMATGIYKAMQGMDETDPAFQQRLDQISRPLRPVLARLFGVQDDPAKPTDWNGIKSLALAGQDTGDGYHPPIATNSGWRQYKNGQWDVIKDGDNPVLPISADPALKATMTNAGEGQKAREITNADQTKSIVTNQALNPGAFQVKPQGKSYRLSPEEELHQRALQGDPDAIAAFEQGKVQGGALYGAEPQTYGPSAEQKTAQEINEYRQKKEIDNQTPKPLNEMQQYQLDEKRDKAQTAKEDAIFNINEAIAGIDRLTEIQAKTKTGPLSSNAVTATLRKAGSEIGLDSVTGGKNLARLEKGYAAEAVKAIGVFKSIGVTFGALSNAEGNWIKETQAKLDSDGEVNLEMLSQGKALLMRRLEKLKKSGSTGEPDYQNMSIDELLNHARGAK